MSVTGSACCSWKWREAAKSFDAVMRIAPEETHANFWYAAYLLVLGGIEEAKSCAESLLKARVNSGR